MTAILGLRRPSENQQRGEAGDDEFLHERLLSMLRLTANAPAERAAGARRLYFRPEACDQ
jgi:hypothetical protein